MNPLRKIFWLVLAGVFLFEAWLWDLLGDALARLVGVLPIRKWRDAFEAFVGGLSPLASLAVFALPVAPLLPIKLAALYFLAHRHFILGAGCFVVAKLVGFAAGAYLFDLCRPKLLQVAAFARFYAAIIRWRALAQEILAPYRAQLRASMAALRIFLRLNGSSRTSALIARLRARSRRRLATRH